MTIFARDANCVNPPARARRSSTVPSSSARSDSSGRLADDRHLDAANVRHDDRDFRARNVVGELSCQNLAELERGEAGGCTSLMSGSEILPSGRTGTVRLSVSFFHTETSSMSSAPIRYVSGAVVWLAFRSVGVAAGA